MAVRYDPSTNYLDIPQNGKVGTKRYLAPEVLADTINTCNFESFKRADIYALGLVLWEICQRQRTNPLQNNAAKTPFKLPYSDVVGSDPSLEDMRKVVCEDNLRPNIPNSWSTDPLLSEMSTIMEECWYESASARLTAIRVKKNLDLLQTKYRKMIQLTKINEANMANEENTGPSSVAVNDAGANRTKNVNFTTTNNASHNRTYRTMTSDISNSDDPSTALLLPHSNQNQKSGGTKPIRI